MPWVTEELRAQLSDLGELDLPTRYDSPTQYRILTGLITRIKDAASALGLDTEAFPHYACIPTGCVNASAVVLPTVSRPFLLFDSELFLYCHLFAKTFAQCLPVVDQGEMLQLSVETDSVKKRLENTPELSFRFSDLLSAYAVTGSPSRSKQYNPDQDYLQLIDILRGGMELFVVAHEFGHVYSGHLSGLLKRFGLRTEDFVSKNPAHQQEHEADIIGLALTLQAMNNSGYDVGLSYVGIELFFVSLDMAARARHIVLGGLNETFVDAGSDSHPSNEERRALLSLALDSFVKDSEQLARARDLAIAYIEIADLLWEHARTVNPSFRRIP